jgi:hypothetical protein
MKMRRRALILLAVLLLGISSCSRERTSIYAVKIIRWKCENSKKGILSDYTFCLLTVRRHAEETLALEMVEEYWDDKGNKVSACSKCQQKKNNIPSARSESGDFEDVTPTVDDNDDSNIDPTKPWAKAFQELQDEELAHFVLVFPVTLKIAKYKFYFTQPGTSTVISNTAEGVVFQP